MKENRRALVILAMGVVLIIAFFGVKLISGGGGSSDEDLTAPVATGTTRPGATTTTTGPQAQETFEVFTARNPFRALVDTSGGGGGGGGGTGFTSGTGSTGGTGGGQTSGGATTGGGSTTSGTTSTTVNTSGSRGSGEPSSGQRVALLEIFTEQGQRTARIRVGSTVYTAKVGEHFATNYQVTSLGDRCGDFLFGDSPFSLCVGEEVVK